MKKTLLIVLVLILAAFFITSFSGCEKLKLDNLKANNHLKKANKFYTEEKYKKAINEYQEALKLNPNLKVIYFYLGSSYALLYSPSKTTERNKQNGKKALGFLLKAREISDKKAESLRNKAIDSVNQGKKDKIKEEIDLKYKPIEQKIIKETNQMYSNNIEELQKTAEQETKPEAKEKIKLEIEDLQKRLSISLSNKKKEIEEKGDLEFNEKIKEYFSNRYKKQLTDANLNNEKIVLALGDIYDKISSASESEEERENYYKESEKCYLTILENAKTNPQSYYTLARFYLNHGRLSEAEMMYKKPIEMDPKNHQTYLFLAQYYGDSRQWDKAIKYHEKRIYAIMNPEILELQKGVEKIEQKIADMEKIKNFIENVLKKNRSLPKEAKAKLMKEKTTQLEELGSFVDANKELEAKKDEIQELIKKSEEESKNFSEEQKKLLADAYYRVGHVCWNKSYQTKRDMMTGEERRPLIAKGFAALDKSIEFDPSNPFPWSYKALLYFQKKISEPLKSKEWDEKYTEMIEQFKKLRKKKAQAEEYAKQLEEMGKK